MEIKSFFIEVDDMQSALVFYDSKLNLGIKSDVNYPHVVELSKLPITLLKKTTVSSSCTIQMIVKDLDEIINGQDIDVMYNTSHFPSLGTKSATIKDPFGNVITFLEYDNNALRWRNVF